MKDVEWLRNQVATKPLRQIAEEIGSSYSAIVYTVRKHNIQVPHRTKHRFNPLKSHAVIAGLKKKYPNGRLGALSSNWKGGVSKQDHILRTSKKYRRWREAVFQRDGNSCIWCKSTEDLESDHIKPWVLYPELRFDVDNGRVLCNPCHKKTDTHSRYRRPKIV